MAALALFTRAMELSGPQRLLMMLPLCLSIAVVYKTIRLSDLRELAREVLVLWISIIVGMCAVGLGAWILFRIMV